LKAFKLFGFLLIGFCGGCLAPWFVGWLGKIPTTTSTGDAIAIANTYIVFTTLIFVGFTVVLGVAGYFFTQQFAASKEAEQLEVFSQLKQKIKQDEKLGISVLDSLLDNPDVKRHIEEQLQEKMEELIESRITDLQENLAQMQQDNEKLQQISSQFRNGGKRNG